MNKSLRVAGIRLVLLLLIVTPHMGCNREAGLRVGCNRNLKLIGLMLAMYSADHTNQFPRAIEALVPYGIEPAWFICPGTSNKVGTLASLSEWSDYAFITGLTYTDRLEIAHVVEKPGHHERAGGNVLFLDGHVEWVDETVLMALLKEPWLMCPRKNEVKRGLADDEINDLEKRTGIASAETSRFRLQLGVSQGRSHIVEH